MLGSAGELIVPCAKPGSLVSSVLSRSTTIEVNYICWLVELQIWQIAERVRTFFVNELRSVKILDIRRTLRRDGRAYQDEEPDTADVGLMVLLLESHG